jgi:hypothetical protein
MLFKIISVVQVLFGTQEFSGLVVLVTFLIHIKVILCLFFRGTNQVIKSKEEFTQGDILSMQGFAIAVLPLIGKLKKPEKYIQNWFADDSGCSRPLKSLLEWVDLLISEGPNMTFAQNLTKAIALFLLTTSMMLKNFSPIAR